MISPAEVRLWLHQGHGMLEDALPEDIRMIYLRKEEQTQSEQDKEAVPVLSDSV